MWVGNGSGSFATLVILVLALWSRAADGAERARVPGSLQCTHIGSAAVPWFRFSLEITPGFKLCNEGKCKNPPLHTW